MNSSRKPKLLDFRSIQGRIILLGIIFLLLLLTFTAVVTTQNRKTQNVSEKVINFRAPITLAAQSVISGLNRVSASQRAFIMTKEEPFRLERLTVWQNQIEPNLQKLVNERDNLSLNANKARVDSIQMLVAQYKVIQNDIDKYLLENLNFNENAPLTLDSLKSLQTIALVNSIRKKRKILEKMVKDRASPARKNLRNLLFPLANSNLDLLEAEVRDVSQNLANTNILGVVIFFISFTITILLSLSLVRSLKKSIKAPLNLLEELSQGVIPAPVPITNNELSSIIHSGNQLAKNLQQASTFALHIGESKFDENFEPASEKDTLGNALLQMRQKLKKVSIEEKKQKWITEGQAKIGQMLRTSFEDVNQWYASIISFVINYTQVNQGGIYIIEKDIEKKEGENEFVELKACIAFDRQRKVNYRQDIHEGLVGRAIFEKQTIYLKEVPDNYIQITSGLGDASPKNLAIVPLINNEKVIGALEVASFQLLDLHEIDFLEKISDSIASSIISVKTNEETRRLLEVSQEQSESLRKIETEIRQNNEELQATRDDLAQKESELAGRLNALDQSLLSVTFDLDGHVIDVNDNFLEATGYVSQEVVNKHHSIFCAPTYVQSEAYKLFWQDLRNGKNVNGEFKRLTKTGEEIWIKAAYSPILGSEGRPEKVHKVAFNITQSYHQNRDHAIKLANIEHNAAIAEFTMDGTITSANERQLHLWHYDLEEIQGKNFQNLFKYTNGKAADYQELWSKLKYGEVVTKHIEETNKDNGKVFLTATYSPVLDENGFPQRVIRVATDVTEMKKLEAQAIEQNDQLKAQEEILKKKLEQLTETQEDLIRTTEITQLQFKSIFDSITDAVITCNSQGVIQDFNLMAEKFFRYNPEQIVGENINTILPLTDNQTYLEYLHTSVNDLNKTQQGLGRYITAMREDNSSFPAYITVGHSFINGEQLFTSFIRDVTHEVEREKQVKDQIESLNESLEKLEILTEATPQPMFLVNQDGLIEMLNPAAEKLLDYASDELHGELLKVLVGSSKTRFNFKTFLKKHQAKSKKSANSVVLNTKNGEVVEAHLEFSTMNFLDKHWFVGKIQVLEEA
ncbi:MAG TPA: hypothetical protein DCS93_05495 [Microscillaceae bacterium]|nr:hypothetical protein [Microscillaceae bacterium]